MSSLKIKTRVYESALDYVGIPFTPPNTRKLFAEMSSKSFGLFAKAMSVLDDRDLDGSSDDLVTRQHERVGIYQRSKMVLYVDTMVTKSNHVQLDKTS